MILRSSFEGEMVTTGLFVRSKPTYDND